MYIVTNMTRGTLYIGVTSNLPKRIWEHKNGVVDGFTSRYKLNRLVYFESFQDVKVSIGREKQLKNWRRDWKISLIEKNNPKWKDLYGNL